jgi:hypothetical protein
MRRDRRGASEARPPRNQRAPKSMQRTTTIRTRATLAREAITVMEAKYAADLTLDDVARQIATSPVSFSAASTSTATHRSGNVSLGSACSARPSCWPRPLSR